MDWAMGRVPSTRSILSGMNSYFCGNREWSTIRNSCSGEVVDIVRRALQKSASSHLRGNPTSSWRASAMAGCRRERWLQKV